MVDEYCRYEARVSAPDRIARGKLVTQDLLQRYLMRKDYAPFPMAGCISLSTEHASPDETAQEIIEQLDLSERYLIGHHSLKPTAATSPSSTVFPATQPVDL